MLGPPARPLNRFVDRFGQSLRGPFTIQDNNTTRRAEYPWAYFATPLEPGLQVLELGGSLAGFQFVLDRAGCRVTNVDPGNESHGRGWPVDHGEHTDAESGIRNSGSAAKLFLE